MYDPNDRFWDLIIGLVTVALVIAYACGVKLP